jgi:hypothetical protein
MRFLWKTIQTIALSEVEVRELNAALGSLSFIEATATQNSGAKSAPTELIIAYNYAVKKLDRLSRRLLSSRQFNTDGAIPMGDFLFHIQNYKILAEGFFYEELVVNQARWILEHIAAPNLSRSRFSSISVA